MTLFFIYNSTTLFFSVTRPNASKANTNAKTFCVHGFIDYDSTQPRSCQITLVDTAASLTAFSFAHNNYMTPDPSGLLIPWKNSKKVEI